VSGVFRRKPRSPREQALLEETARLLPSGARSPSADPRHAMLVRDGRGARLVDESGNEYVDFLMGSGSLLLGHAHPAVVDAVRKRLERGSSYLMLSEPAVELARELVRAVPCAEKVCLTNTGSRRPSTALRLARAFRRRDRSSSSRAPTTAGRLRAHERSGREPAALPLPVPTLGIPRSAEGDVSRPFANAVAAVALIDRHHDELGAVIVAPLQRTIPPKPGFLEALRDATTRHGIPLVFDEIVTGFRLAYGGAQEYYGVVPDLCATGKGLSSGHPIAAICGRAEILDAADGARLGSREYVSLTGTYSGNPLSCAAGLASLEVLRRPGSYERLFALGRRFMRSLQGLLDAAGLPARVTGEPPAFQVWFGGEEVVDHRSVLRTDAANSLRFTELLLDRGILKAHEKFFVSTAHSDEEVDLALEACAWAIEQLAASGPARARGEPGGQSPCAPHSGKRGRISQANHSIHSSSSSSAVVRGGGSCATVTPARSSAPIASTSSSRSARSERAVPPGRPAVAPVSATDITTSKRPRRASKPGCSRM
jgi:glutamate-1-semialdehyde 2,1-aminomutase